MRGEKLIILAMCALLAFAGGARADSLVGHPSLRESHDPALQRGLERIVDRLGLRRAVRDGHLSLALVDITDLDSPRVAELNGDRMFYAASLPKIAILLGAMVQVERGRMRLDQPTRESLTQMIRVSSNEEATRVMNIVGKRRVNEILASQRFRLYDPLVNGGLWVGKEYAKSPAYTRDPLHNLSHGATAMQVARFYYRMETGDLLGPRLSREMKTFLSRPGIRHKFVKGLGQRPGMRLYRKSGSWRRWHADSVLVEFGRYRYIAVALADDARGGRWMEQVIRPMHELVVPPTVAGLR